MTLSFQCLLAALLVLWSIGYVATRTAAADVAKPGDVAGCNAEARDAINAGSAARGNAQPNTSDHDRAAHARQSETSPPMRDPATRSLDAQLDGMDTDGAKDPAYQAAFRGCMRRKGF
jgi:hypothetical protein